MYWDNLFNDPDTRHSIILTLTVVLFVSYKLMLSSGVSSLADLAASIRQ